MKFKIIFALMIFFIVIGDIYAYSIKIEKNQEDGWVLYEETGAPYIIKGICYSPTPVGKSVWEYNLFTDENTPWLIDGDYMEKINANTIRIYDIGNDEEACKDFIRQMYKMYSIYTLFPLPFTMEGADFASDSFKADLKAGIIKIVETYKDTPGIIVWLLGNEIDYYFYDDKAVWETMEMEEISGSYQRAKMRARIIFEFASDVVRDIQKIDPDHPVGISLGFTTFFPLIETHLNNVDFVGLNYYQGRNFSSVWSLVKKIDKPVLITEFGYDAFNTKENKEDYRSQAVYISDLWEDIYDNSFFKKGKSFALGGCVFEWTDEWWKNSYNDPRIHDKNGTWPNSAWLDFSAKTPKNVQEEWFGIMGVLPSVAGIDRRFPREVYYKLRKLWNTENN